MTLKASHPKLLHVAVPLERWFGGCSMLWVKGGVHRGKQKAGEIPQAQEPEQQHLGVSALLLSSSLLFLNKNITVGVFWSVLERNRPALGFQEAEDGHGPVQRFVIHPCGSPAPPPLSCSALPCPCPRWAAPQPGISVTVSCAFFTLNT